MNRKKVMEKKEKIKKQSGKKMKEKMEPQYYRSVSGDRTLNYHVYYMSTLEKILYFLLAFAAGAAAGYLFYGGIGKDEYGDPTVLTYILNTMIMLVCGMVAGKLFLPVRNQQILDSRQKKLRSQFRDMLEALATSLGSGKNIPESFLSAYKDLENQYEEGTFILQELKIINNGIVNGITVEELIGDFGRRSACPDIEDFAGVFEVCYRRGGNIRETIRNTCRIIADKMAVAQEIETTVTGSKNEQYIMLVLPVLMVGMIKMSSPDFAANFASPSGIISTTIGIALFAASYFVGKKLLDIKV